MSLVYLSSVSGLPTGLAGSTTVAAQSTSGGAPAAASGAVVGTTHETTTPGTYICLVTYTLASLPLGTIPWVNWSVGGSVIDDPLPVPTNGVLDQIAGDGSLNMRQILNLILAAVSAKLAGLPAGPAVIRDAGDTANRITVAFDANNNRTAVTYNPPT